MQKIIITAPTFSIEVAGDNERDLIEQASFWLSLPTKCGFKDCGKPLVLDYLTPQGYKYYALKCTGQPAHRLNLGQQKETHKLYFDASKQWELFRPGTHNETPGPATPETASPDRQNTANIGQLKNQLIKLINECKNAGLRTGILPADVGPMDERTVSNEFDRLNGILNSQGVSA